MKKIAIIIAFAFAVTGCRQSPEQNNVSISSNTTAGFDVNKLGDLVKTSTDPQVLEKAVNDPNNRINNLDLDKDGKVDYLKVTEPGKNELQVVDDISSSQSVTVASIKVDPTNNNTADLNIQGNPSYAGDNNYYHSSFSFTDFLLLSYLMRPHSYYMPLYHYGSYPSHYTRTSVVTNYRPTTSSAVSSPRRSSLSSPSGSQRSFHTRDNSQPVRSGGFGSSSSSSRSSGFGSSRRSFGGSRSGFGRRR
ncbi:hypothetical protein [Pedobacter sp. L105]|uniref:hypothetical protein n=1 Tax=Pedobacter sp. L105 TaxID=1641871 RepID=UPI00131AC47C|nr:hypothetical protein [Pedobacter sp. L105]